MFMLCIPLKLHRMCKQDNMIVHTCVIYAYSVHSVCCMWNHSYNTSGSLLLCMSSAFSSRFELRGFPSAQKMCTFHTFHAFFSLFTKIRENRRTFFLFPHFFFVMTSSLFAKIVRPHIKMCTVESRTHFFEMLK